MQSKLVTDREKSTNAVLAAARTHGAIAAEAIAGALEGVLAKGAAGRSGRALAPPAFVQW